MDITEVRIDLVDWEYSGRDNRLRAYASVCFDGVFVVHGIRVIALDDCMLVAMPNRRDMEECGECGERNLAQARWCNWCGVDLDPHDPPRSRDICHPITRAFRDRVTSMVLHEYNRLREGKSNSQRVVRFSRGSREDNLMVMHEKTNQAAACSAVDQGRAATGGG